MRFHVDMTLWQVLSLTAPFWVGLERVGWGTFKEAKDNWIFSWFNCNPMYTLNLGFVSVQRSSHGNWSRYYWIDCTAVMIHGIDLSTVAGNVWTAFLSSCENSSIPWKIWELRQLHMSKPHMNEFGHPDSVTEEVFVRAQAVWYALGQSFGEWVWPYRGEILQAKHPWGLGMGQISTCESKLLHQTKNESIT